METINCCSVIKPPPPHPLFPIQHTDQKIKCWGVFHNGLL